MKFEQDFDELIKFNEKINKLRKDIVDLETELVLRRKLYEFCGKLWYQDKYK